MARVGTPRKDQNEVVWFNKNNQESRYWFLSCFLFCFLLCDVCGLEESPPTQLNALGASFGGYSSPPSVAGTEHSLEDRFSEEGGEEISSRDATREFRKFPPNKHKVLLVQQSTTHGNQLSNITKPDLLEYPYQTAFVGRTKRDGRRHRKRIHKRIRYRGNPKKKLRKESSYRKRKARNQDAPSGRIQIANNGSYISPLFQRKVEGVSSFRHYKDFQNDLKYSETNDKTAPSLTSSSPSNLLSSIPHSVNPEKIYNSDQGLGNSASHSDFKFPDTIVKDGQIFYRHDGTDAILATISPPQTTAPPKGDVSHYSTAQDPSRETNEPQVHRGFNLLMDHVRQVGGGVPIISAAIAGASVRGSSNGSSSHVVGSAINGGYFAASAQGYDGKGGAIHSHVRGTSERVSGGASAIAPDRDGEAFIQVDHSEKGLSIGQSSTHNGDAFVIADIDSESKRILEHGDSTSSYSNTYQTKRFGHTFGEAKSNISPIKPRTETGWNEIISDNIDNQGHNKKQRSIGIDMISNIMEKVHLPNTRSLPSSRISPDPQIKDNILNQDLFVGHQENHNGFRTPYEERKKARTFLTGIDQEYLIEENDPSTEAKKKGTVGVVTFPYDHEGLPPGPGELLDQSLPIHSSSLPSFSNTIESSGHAALDHHAKMEDSDTTEEEYKNINRLPLFSGDVLGGNNHPINSFAPHHYDFTNRNNFIEYQHPHVEERLSSDTYNKNDNRNKHSNFDNSNDLDYDKSLIANNIPGDPRNTENFISPDYLDHPLRDYNLTQISRDSGQFDDYLYDNSYFKHRKFSLENNTFEENNPNYLYSHTYDNGPNFVDESYHDVRPFDAPVVSGSDSDNSRHIPDLDQDIEQDYNPNSFDYWSQNGFTNRSPYYPSPSDQIPYYSDIYDAQLTTRRPIDYELYDSLEAGRTSSLGGNERDYITRDLQTTTIPPDVDSTNKPLPDFLDLGEERNIIAEDKRYNIGPHHPSDFDQIPYHYPDVNYGHLTTEIPVDYDIYNSFDDKTLSTGRAYPPQNETGKVDFGSYSTVVSPHLEITTKHPTVYSDLSNNTIQNIKQTHTPFQTKNFSTGKDKPEALDETLKVNFGSYPTVVSSHLDFTTKSPTDHFGLYDNTSHNITSVHTTNRIDWGPEEDHEHTVTLTTTPTTASLPPYIGPENKVHHYDTHFATSTEVSHPNYWQEHDTEKWPHLPSESDASFRGPPSSHDNKRTKVIPAGRAGSSHLLEPPSPSHPYVRIISLDHSTPRHPQHMDGIMLDPDENIPGLPGYRIPPGFRGKIIFGKFVSTTGNNRHRSYDHNFPSFRQRQLPRHRGDYISGRTSSYRYHSEPRDSKRLRSTRNNYSPQVGSLHHARRSCKDHPDCDSRRGSRNKNELCNFSRNGVCCC